MDKFELCKMFSVKEILIVMIPPKHVEVYILFLQCFGQVVEFLPVEFFLFKSNTNITAYDNCTVFEIVSVYCGGYYGKFPVQITCKQYVLCVNLIQFHCHPTLQQ